MYTLLITYFLLAIVTSFLCSMWEAVLLSITPSYAHVKQAEGSNIGKQIEQFKRNIDKPLAAILTLNTIAHTVGAIGVGEQATRIWADTNPLITGLAVPALMTLGILILSEIIPKTLGANFWKELAPFTIRSLKIVIVALYPLVWLSQLITKRLKKDKDSSVLSRSDFAVLAEVGVRTGVFEHAEAEIIRNLLRFRSVQAQSVMTPRTVLFTAPEETTVKDFYEQNRGTLRFSRIPVYKGADTEEITGYVRKDEVFQRMAEDRGGEMLSDLRRDIIIAPEAVAVTSLFNRMRDSREHIAMVVDEFGGVAGIVTMEDIIETLLGLEIVDESDAETDMQHLARRIWERRAGQLGLTDEQSSEGAPDKNRRSDS